MNTAGRTTSAYKGLVDLRDKYGMQIAYTENVKPADQEPIVRDYAKAGFDIIFAHGYEAAFDCVRGPTQAPLRMFGLSDCISPANQRLPSCNHASFIIACLMRRWASAALPVRITSPMRSCPMRSTIVRMACSQSTLSVMASSGCSR